MMLFRLLIAVVGVGLVGWLFLVVDGRPVALLRSLLVVSEAPGTLITDTASSAASAIPPSMVPVAAGVSEEVTATTAAAAAEVSVAHAAALAKLGIAVEDLTPAVRACAETKIGSARVAAVVEGGEMPTVVEVAKVMPCLAAE